MATVLLTLGRLPVALELSRALYASGHRVVVAEPMGWPLARWSRSVSRCYRTAAPVDEPDTYGRQLADIVRRESVDRVVPVSEEILWVSRLREHLPVVSMPHDVLLSLHDKWRFAARARDLGLPVPESARADSVDAVRIRESSDWVCKRRMSCSGVGVVLGERGEALPAGLLHGSRSHLVQRRIGASRDARGSDACASFSLCREGQVLHSVVYRPLVESASVAVCFESIEMPGSIRRCIDRVVADLAFTGMIGFDFMTDDDARSAADCRWQVIECNPRATSGVHLMPTSVLQHWLHATLAITNSARDQAMPTPTIARKSTSDTTSEVAEFQSTRRQVFWPHLSVLQARLLGGRFERAAWRRLRRTPDVVGVLGDRLPLCLMPVVSLPLFWRAVRQRLALVQVAMHDLSWTRLDERDSP